MAKVARFSQDNQNPVGMIVHSMLTEAQFQAINGTNWVLADGRDVTGSAYAQITLNTTAPDARGLFLRSAGTRGSAIGGITYSGGSAGNTSNDSVQGHKHTDSGHSHVANFGTGGGTSGMGFMDFDYNTNERAVIQNGSANLGDPTATTYGTPRVGAETKPANLAVNVFIKIN